ncbi:MAG: FGGY family carbohydrate kinase, partial [Bacilli bacterium]
MNALAIDLGASNGRVVVGTYGDQTIRLQEVHRFANDPVQAGERLHWDILRLLHEVKQGILRANQGYSAIESMGIDSWAVDFGLLDANGELLGNPYHYRDSQTLGMVKAVGDILPREWLYGRTGIQILPINTIYQLRAMFLRNSVWFREARSLLLIPELLRYFLTGRRVSEYTNASTTQLLNLHTRDWDPEILGRLRLPPTLFGEIAQPGTLAG